MPRGLDDLDTPLGWRKIYSNGFSENLLTAFLKIDFDKSFSRVPGSDRGQDESSSPSLPGAPCCFFWGCLRPPSPAALGTVQLGLFLSSPPLQGRAGPHWSDWKTRQGIHVSSPWKIPIDLLPAFCCLASISCQ